MHCCDKNKKIAVLCLSVAIWLALIHYGMSTAGLGESTVSYGVLDDAVRPYLIAKMPLSGTSVDEWVAMANSAYTKYGRVRRRRRRKKSRQRLPPTWLQTMVPRILHTVLQVRVQLTILRVKSILTILLIRILLSVLYARARRKAIRLNHRLHQCLQSVVHCPLVVAKTMAGYASSVIEMLLMRSGDVEPNPGPCLMVCDLRTVLHAVWGARKRWSEIGLELGLSVDDLENIEIEESDNGRRLQRVLRMWLRTTDLNPSWTSLAEALKSPIVGRQDIAHEIEQNPPSAGKSSSQYDPTLPESLTKYSDYLKAEYSVQELSDLDYDKWPPTQSTCYITLASISKEGVTKEQADEFTKDTLHGNVDQILKKKKSIKMEEILAVTESGKKPKCVLVEGGPGVGKTTFSWEVCKRWSRGQLFQEYSIVVHLRLRDEEVRNANKISDLFHYDDEDQKKKIFADIVEGQGKGVLLILDGLDELPSELLAKSSIFGHLLSGQSLRLATIIVTSRPSVTDMFLSTWKSKVSRHIEILGFTRQSVEDYIKSVLPAEHIPSFMKYLSQHPHIRTMMYIPLNSAIVTEVYKQNQRSSKPVPTTATQLYTELSHTLLMRYLDDHKDYKDKKLDITFFSKLPTPVLSDFKKLCEVAYSGLVKQELVFYNLDKSFEHLGFMHSSKRIFDHRSVATSYSFLHLSIQEYLAAVHVSGMSPDQQMELFKKQCKPKRMVVHGDPDCSHLNNMWRYVCGLTKLKGFDLSTVMRYLLPRVGAIKGDLRCIEFLHEAQDRECLNIFEGSIVQVGEANWIQVLRPNVCHSLAYCITNSHCSWDLTIELEDEVVEIFGNGLSRCKDSHSSTICSIVWYKASPRHLLNLPQHLLLGFRQLSLNTVTTDTNTLTEIITAMTNLDSLYLCGCTITMEDAFFALHRGLNTALHCTIEKCQTQYGPIHFYTSHIATKLSPEGIVLLSEFLCTNASIKELNMSGSRFNPESARAFGGMLKVNQSLIKVNIEHCHIGDEEAQYLAEGLQHNTVLQELNISHNPVKAKGINALANGLCKNKKLKTLNMSECRFNPESAQAFGAMLKVNQSLIKVNIAHCHIGDEEAQYLAEGLQHSTALQNLKLSGNLTWTLKIMDSLSHKAVLDVQHSDPFLRFQSPQCTLTAGLLPTDIVLLSQFLCTNTSVKELNMSESRFNPESAQAFGAMLKVNQSLIKVNIEDCHIRDEEAQHLAEGLQHNTVLQDLYMTI